MWNPTKILHHSIQRHCTLKQRSAMHKTASILMWSVQIIFCSLFISFRLNWQMINDLMLIHVFSSVEKLGTLAKHVYQYKRSMHIICGFKNSLQQAQHAQHAHLKLCIRGTISLAQISLMWDISKMPLYWYT